jgi:hypothetical protein
MVDLFQLFALTVSALIFVIVLALGQRSVSSRQN